MLRDLRRRAAGACQAVLVVLVLAPPPALVLVLVAPASPVAAQQSLVAGGLSEDEAVALVRERADGKVVRVDRTLEGVDVVYRVRVLTPDGRLREYRVDAATGRMR